MVNKNTSSFLENPAGRVDIMCGLDGQKLGFLISGVCGETYGNVYLVLSCVFGFSLVDKIFVIWFSFGMCLLAGK